MNRGIPQHMVYYAPECEHSQALIQRLQQSHVAFSFNAFDVTQATPPSYIQYVPTIVVFGTALVGSDAFAWIDRIQGSDAVSNGPLRDPSDPGSTGYRSAADEDDKLSDGPGPFTGVPSEPVVVSNHAPIDTRNPAPAHEEKIKEGTVDLEDLKRQRESELPKLRPVAMPEPTIVSSTS